MVLIDVEFMEVVFASLISPLMFCYFVNAEY